MHDVLAKVDDPIKIPTPYGGRLQWTLPGENTLTVHLKDSAKIRHKKRWSQVCKLSIDKVFSLNDKILIEIFLFS